MNGNDNIYSVELTKTNADSILKGKKIIFLGSSVTYGSKSDGESFVEYLEKADGIIPYKEAVSGTTLIDNGDSSYISRMKKINTALKADAFICQLSTNDAKKELPLGEFSESYDIKDFDTSKIAGAIEYIITYAKNTWHCPVMFYTGTKFENDHYEKMINLLYEISEKHNIFILDMWNDEEMNAVSEKEYELYMADGVHPKKAGYKLWWLPKFEEAIINILRK